MDGVNENVQMMMIRRRRRSRVAIVQQFAFFSFVLPPVVDMQNSKRGKGK